MEVQVKKKTSLLKIIVISLLVLALIFFIGYLTIIYGLNHNTTEFGKNVSVFVGWLIYYFSSIAVHNKETWYGKLIAETMSKRWYIDVNVFGDVIKDASFAVVVLLLSIIVFFIIIIILEIDSILNKREYLVKGFILLSVCCLVFGGGFYVYKYTPFVENIKKEQEKVHKEKEEQERIKADYVNDTSEEGWIEGKFGWKEPPEHLKIRNPKYQSEYIFYYHFHGNDYTFLTSDNGGKTRTVYSGYKTFDTLDFQDRVLIDGTKDSCRTLLLALEAGHKLANAMDKKYGRK